MSAANAILQLTTPYMESGPYTLKHPLPKVRNFAYLLNYYTLLVDRVTILFTLMRITKFIRRQWRT